MAHHSKPLPPDETPNRDFPVLTENTDLPPNADLGAPPEIKGRFKRGQSGNPKGRPKGAFNKSTMAARAVLEKNATRLMGKAVELAMKGSVGPLKLCLERLVPRERLVQMAMPAPQSAPTEILAIHSSLLASVAEGEITPQEARAISALLEARRRSWEATDLSDQLNRIEENQEAARRAKGRPR